MWHHWRHLRVLVAQRDAKAGQPAGAASVLTAALGLAGIVYFTGPVPLRAEQLPNRGRALAEITHAREQVLERLGRLAMRSEAVLSVTGDQTRPFVDLLLWAHDDFEPGAVNRSELVLLSFSRALQSISIYRLDHSGTIESDPVVGWNQLQRPAFCDQWRSLPVVEARVICRGVSDLSLEISEADAMGPAVLRIGLRWSGDSADSTQERSVGVGLAAHRSSAKES